MPASSVVATAFVDYGWGTTGGAGLAFGGQSLLPATPCARRQQAHFALVREQLILQLHIHRFAFDLMHLSVNTGGAELQLRFSGGGAPVDLVAHLVERYRIVAQLKTRHRLRQLLLQLGL